MNLFDEDALRQLKFLDDEIAKLTARDPLLRSKYQQVRAAHTVAEALGDLIGRAKLSFEEVAEIASMPSDVIEAALTASSDKPATLETVATIAQVAGFRFELQFIPESLHSEKVDSANEEITQDGVPGGVLIRFPFPFERRDAYYFLHNGVRRIIKKSSESIISEELNNFKAKSGVEMWELVQFSEQAGFKLQFRFSRKDKNIATEEMDAQNIELGEYQELNPLSNGGGRKASKRLGREVMFNRGLFRTVWG